MSKIFALITARGGSKGVPKKNIKNLKGYPLIAYSIIAAKLSKKIDRVIVSTDCEEIAEISRSYGAEVPFMRPAEFASDSAGDKEVIVHFLDWLKENEGEEPDLVVQLRPTTPLRSPGLIDEAIEKLIEDLEATSLRSAHEMPESPRKVFEIQNGRWAGLFPDDPRQEYYNLPRQNFPLAYHPNGYVDIIKTSFVRENVKGSLHGPSMHALVTPFSIEVDCNDDFDYLEYDINRKGHALYNSLVEEYPLENLKVESRFRQINNSFPNPADENVFSDLSKYEAQAMHGQLPIVWDKAKDFQVWDKHGNCWIDFTSTIFVANVGHANDRVKKYIQEVMDKDLLHSYTYATEIRAKYLKKLIEFVPDNFEKAFLLSSGTEATECALKLIKMWGANHGKSKGGIISFEHAMHGRTLGAQIVGGNEKGREWVGYEDPNVYRMEFPYPWNLIDEYGDKISGKEKFQKDISRLKEQGVDFDKDISGFILEAYIGWGAVMIPKDYVEELANFAREHKILVCVDEIQGGFGRSGKLFVYEHYGIKPDLICCGKGMSSSLPLSAVLGSKEIMDTPGIGSMSSTHSANPLCCAAGLANIEEIEEKGLVEESRRKGEILHRRLREIKNKYPKRISYIFGEGLLAGILIRNPMTGGPDGDFATKVCHNALNNGLLLVHTGRESIKIGPPLTISDEALIEGLDVFEECIEEAIKNEGN